MKLIRDLSNSYLKDKVPDAVFDKFETYWLLQNDTNSIPKINLKNNDVLISGTYKFENHQKLDPINEWYRSGIKKELKPKIIKKIDLISQDQRKIYYDFLKLEHKNIYDFPISFISKSDAISWLDSSFLADNYHCKLQNYFLKVLGEVALIVLKGHNHQYMEDVTLFICKRNSRLFEGNVFEDTTIDFNNYRDWIFINSIFH